MDEKIKVRVQGQDKKVYYKEPSPDRIKMYYEYTQDNFRKGKDYNLKLKKFARITNWKKMTWGLFLDIEGDCIHNTQIDCDGELRPIIDDTVETEHFKGFLRLEVYEKGIFRLLAGEGGERQHHTVMLEGVPPLQTDQYEVKEEGDMFHSA